MFEFLALVLFCWIFFKALRLAFRATWGIAKVLVWLVLLIAVPVFIGCLIFAGGLVILIPLALVGLVFGLLKALL